MRVRKPKTEGEKVLAVIRDPSATKKQKKIIQLKWRFNQLPDWAREGSYQQDYLRELKRLEAEPEQPISEKLPPID